MPQMTTQERRIWELEKMVRDLKDRLAALEGRLAAAENKTSVGTPLYTGRDLIYFKAPGGGIPARSGTTLGMAVCRRWYRDGSTLVDAGSDGDIPMYNVSTVAVGANKYGVAGEIDGAASAIVESCG